VHWAFAPVLDTERDLRWGRSYEPFSEDPFLNGTLGTALIRGLQSPANPYGRVAATAKHFVGYSAPDNGQDRTDATISEPELQDLHLPPFEQAIDAGVDTVMVNSGSVNGVPVHASHHLLTEVLRGQLGFQGVVVSDWQDIENLITKYKVAADMEHAVALAVNAGIDMSMIPLDAPGFTTAMRAAVRDGLISRRRIDQSVERILRLKFKLGLFDDPYADADAANDVVEDPADVPLARRAARESLVLLDNRSGALPLGADAGKILVTGPASDSPAYQLGGWSIGWQGAFDLPPDVTLPPTTTIRAGIEAAAPDGVTVSWSQGVPPVDTRRESTDPGNDPDAPATKAAIDAAVAAAADVDTIVVAVGERGYAETPGSVDRPVLRASQAALVDALEATGKPVIIVVVAGRPLEMDDQLAGSAANLMAFWPGREGGNAIADVLFGNYSPSGRLPVSWPRNGTEYPLAYNEPGAYNPRYPFGHTRSYERFVVDRLRAPDTVDEDATVTVRARLTNQGDAAAEHVMLATVERVDGSETAAPRQLVGFERVRLGAGESTRVRLDFDVYQLATTPADGGYRRVEPGTYRLRVDGTTIEFEIGDV
jgi:beta-glucosidase